MTLLCVRGTAVYLVAKRSLSLFSTDEPPPNVVHLKEKNKKAENCLCQIKDVICNKCGSVVGYYVTKPCRICMSCENNGHFWLFNPQAIKARERPQDRTTPPQQIKQLDDEIPNEQCLKATEQQLKTRLQEKERELQQVKKKVKEKRAEVAQLQQQLQEKDASIQRMDYQLSHQREENTEPHRRLDAAHAQLEQKESELQRLHARTAVASQEIDFWQISRQDLQIREEKVLGRGAWGFVCEGYFRGTRVAVKCVYPDILLPQTRERIRREITTMAQVRHPNLVLFIAAILEDKGGPKVITEILDTSLRAAYEKNRLGANNCKLRIFRDVAAAMNYLHNLHEPIIHRDLSSANVLLEAMAGGVWKAKVSDFGSANLVRLATTLGEGALVYTAPEAFPLPPYSPAPRLPQTPKIDVYSYGVLLCEVVLAQFPDSDSFSVMVGRVSGVWPLMHELIVDCIKYSPVERPSMADILGQLDKRIVQ